MQLLAWGSQNIKLNGNPSMTFFKKIYRAHSNFSMESIRVGLNRTTLNVYEKTTLRAKIERHGDMVQQIYFVVELPDILPNYEGFRWVENLGEALIDNYYVTIGGIMVDRQYGEQLHIQNSLSMPTDKRQVYEKMIGNRKELIEPFKPFQLTHNNLTLYLEEIYPAVPSRKIYMVFNLWFNRDPSLALPLIALQYSDIEVVIETRPLMEVYRVIDPNDKLTYISPHSFIAPDPNKEEHKLINLVDNSRVTWMKTETVLEMNAYLEVNYYFLDQREREFITYNSHEYLIEQTYRIQRYRLQNNNIFDLVLQNPIKEFFWVLRRSDVNKYNRWTTFTDEDAPIIKECKIMFNGLDRIDEKDYGYFNYLQPFQHHTGCPKEGVHVYSFSLNPDEGLFQPSGACNMSRINKVQMMVNTYTPKDASYYYDFVLYAIGYNFFKITNGLAGVVFSA